MADVETQAMALRLVAEIRLVADNLEDYLDPEADSDMDIFYD